MLLEYIRIVRSLALFEHFLVDFLVTLAIWTVWAPGQTALRGCLISLPNQLCKLLLQILDCRPRSLLPELIVIQNVRDSLRGHRRSFGHYRPMCSPIVHKRRSLLAKEPRSQDLFARSSLHRG